MKISQNAKDFLINSAKLSDNNILYLIDKTYCYAEVNSCNSKFKIKKYPENISFLKQSDLLLSNSNFTFHTNSSGNYMIHKINNNFFLVSYNTYRNFEKAHIEYANTTVSFLNKLLK